MNVICFTQWGEKLLPLNSKKIRGLAISSFLRRCCDLDKPLSEPKGKILTIKERLTLN
jgi:hypothetical protein